MQILKNVALFQINNNPVEYMLINTLFGTVEILDEEEAKIVAIWIENSVSNCHLRKLNFLKRFMSITSL